MLSGNETLRHSWGTRFLRWRMKKAMRRMAVIATAQPPTTTGRSTLEPEELEPERHASFVGKALDQQPSKYRFDNQIQQRGRETTKLNATSLGFSKL